MKKMIVLLLVAAFVSTASAARMGLDGPTDGDWYNAANWKTIPWADGDYYRYAGEQKWNTDVTGHAWYEAGKGLESDVNVNANVTTPITHSFNAKKFHVVGDLTIDGSVIRTYATDAHGWSDNANGFDVGCRLWNSPDMLNTAMTVNLLSGSITCEGKGAFTVGRALGPGDGSKSPDPDGTLNMSGGTITAYSLMIGDPGYLTWTNRTNMGTVNQSGGAIYADNLVIDPDYGYYAISGSARLVLTGNQLALVNQLIDEGLLDNATGTDPFLAGGNTVIPEPVTMALLGLGGLFIRRRMKS